MHLSDGDIRANLDQAHSRKKQAQVQAHLAQCAACRARASLIEENARFTAGQIAALPAAPVVQFQPATTRRRLEAYFQNKSKEVSFMPRFLSRLPRSAWAGIAILLLLAAVLSFPSVRAAASSFLGLFRVQKIQLISIDTTHLDKQLGDSAALQAIFDKNMQVEQTSPGQEVAEAAEAAALVNFQVRSPEYIQSEQGTAQDEPRWAVSPGGWLEFKIHIEQINTLLYEINRADLRLPRQLEGEIVRVDVQSGVRTTWGNCIPETVQGGDPDEPFKTIRGCTTLLQMPSPTLTAPDGLDPAMLGEIYLEAMGLPRPEAQRLAATIDWSSTLVLPIPRYEASYEEVSVDGVSGVLIKSQYSPEYALLWVREGIVYALSGTQSPSEALRIANSLK